MKLGYGQALQHQDFASAGLSGAPAGVNSLGGKVVTSSALIGLSARPLPKLNVHADLRYEDKDDQTPIQLYNLEGTSTSTNRHLSSTRTRGKLQGSYQFSSTYRGSLTASMDSIDRGVFTATSAVSGLSALRQKTDETSLGAEVRRTMSDTVSATLGLSRSERSGSNWLRDNSGLGLTEVADPNSAGSGLGASAIYMPTLADRQRDTLKLRTDWQPSDELALQLSADTGRDRYKTPSAQGLNNSNNLQLALDASYALSERWNLTGYASHGRQTLLQSRPASYIMSYTNTTRAFGFGATGKPVSKVDVGAMLSLVTDRSVYAQALDASASSDSVILLGATGGLPDIVYRQAQLKLFTRYEIDKQSAARIDLVHQRVHLADWTWGYNGVPFAYSDGSTLSQKPDQAVTAISVSYTLRWQ
jgi:MtrB/PioB family decaheme-associated outer membrane protein